MKKWSIALWMILGAAILAASDYKIKTVKVLPIESYPARIDLSGIIIAADPYSTDAKSYSAFDVKHLNSRGYFPLHVIIKNDTSMFLNIGTRDVVLVTNTGQHLYATPAALVVDDILKAGFAYKRPKKASKDTDSPISDFINKELVNRTIEQKSVIDGFLFFFTPNPRINPFAGSTLYIPKIEEDGTNKTLGPFFIPLDAAASLSKTTEKPRLKKRDDR
jgi:hypothetical protein